MAFALALVLVATFWLLLVLVLILPFALTVATATFPALVELAVDERLLRLGVLQSLNFPLMSCLPLVESIHFNCVLLPLCLETGLLFGKCGWSGVSLLDLRGCCLCKRSRAILRIAEPIPAVFYSHP